MGITESIIKHQLEQDYYNDKKPDFIVGLAERAVELGYDTLSDKQKAILEPHLSQKCEGIRDPGGYHNNCEKILEGDDLDTAYEQAGFRSAVLCSDCMEEEDYQESQWEKFNRE
ncbi:hypothetical protein ACTAJO_000726 [Vibrio fluvialis]